MYHKRSAVNLQVSDQKRSHHIPNMLLHYLVKYGQLQPFFHCYKQKFMARKREVLPPTAPLLCDHIT